jgi:hypothetical protein
MSKEPNTPLQRDVNCVTMFAAGTLYHFAHGPSQERVLDPLQPPR